MHLLMFSIKTLFLSPTWEQSADPKREIAKGKSAITLSFMFRFVFAVVLEFEDDAFTLEMTLAYIVSDHVDS